MSDLKDKVVLVTGSSAGIGEGIALHLAKLGCKLTLTGRNSERLQNVVKFCTLAGLDDSKILFIVGDITSDEHQENLIKKTIEKFGRLDVLVNNAGLSFLGNQTTTTKQIYDEIMSVNLRAVFFLTQLAIPHLKETKGNIINISSVACYTPFAGVCVYSMSKTALDMYTKCLAVELGPSGVRANTISPGLVHSLITRRGNTPMTDEATYNATMDLNKALVPIGRIGDPEDIAKAVAFLASNEQSSYMTGDNMYIDGGLRFSKNDVAISENQKLL